jgi:muconolactone delta-isomerase
MAVRNPRGDLRSTADRRGGGGVGSTDVDERKAEMKFLVLWRIELSRLSGEVLKAVMSMPDHAKPLEEQGKIVARYHVVGAHGGAWIYNVDSNEELEMLLVRSPVYNVSTYQVFPLADMTTLPVQTGG